MSAHYRVTRGELGLDPTAVDATADVQKLSPCARLILRTLQGPAQNNGLKAILHRTFDPSHAGFSEEETLAAVTELLALDVIEVHEEMPLPGGEVGDGYALTNWGFFVRAKL